MATKFVRCSRFFGLSQAVAVCVCAIASAAYAQNERLTLYGHGDVVSAVAYAPDVS